MDVCPRVNPWAGCQTAPKEAAPSKAPSTLAVLQPASDTYRLRILRHRSRHALLLAPVFLSVSTSRHGSEAGRSHVDITMEKPLDSAVMVAVKEWSDFIA